MKTIVVGDYPYTEPIRRGTVPWLAPVNVTPLIAAFRRMVRGLEFDHEQGLLTRRPAAEEVFALDALPARPALRRRADWVNAAVSLQEWGRCRIHPIGRPDR